MHPSPYTLADLGWSADLLRQLTPDETATLTPARVAAVHRDRLSVLTLAGSQMLSLPPDLSAGAVAVGDWVLADPAINRVTRLLDRKSRIARRAAGEASHEQLIVANVDTVFLVTSCNAEFNEARLERFLALAHSGGIPPVVVLTKADTCDDPDAYVERVRAIAPLAPTLVLNAKDPAAVDALRQWCFKGQTVAFLGTSGVGKSTLVKALTGLNIAIGDIREADAKGRHTTTARELHALPGGGWLIDTPGMRELRLSETAEGIDTAFADIVDLALTCRFTNCHHGTEPGCAVRAAIAKGRLDPARLTRWRKLKVEDKSNSASMAVLRHKSRATGKIPRQLKHAKQRLQDD